MQAEIIQMPGREVAPSTPRRISVVKTMHFYVYDSEDGSLDISRIGRTKIKVLGARTRVEGRLLIRRALGRHY